MTLLVGPTDQEIVFFFPHSVQEVEVCHMTQGPSGEATSSVRRQRERGQEEGREKAFPGGFSEKE